MPSCLYMSKVCLSRLLSHGPQHSFRTLVSMSSFSSTELRTCGTPTKVPKSQTCSLNHRFCHQYALIRFGSDTKKRMHYHPHGKVWVTKDFKGFGLRVRLPDLVWRIGVMYVVRLRECNEGIPPSKAYHRHASLSLHHTDMLLLRLIKTDSLPHGRRPCTFSQALRWTHRFSKTSCVMLVPQWATPVCFLSPWSGLVP